MEKISHVKFWRETASKAIRLHQVSYPKPTTGSTMAHLFNPTANAIRISKQLSEPHMVGAKRELAALLTLLPIRLMKGPRHRAPQLIEMLVAIFQTTEQTHFHNSLAIKLQRVWLAFYPCPQH